MNQNYKQEQLLQISERLRMMITDESADNQNFLNTVDTLLNLLEEYLEE